MFRITKPKEKALIQERSALSDKKMTKEEKEPLERTVGITVMG